MKFFFTLLMGFFCLAKAHAQQFQPVDDKSALTFKIKNFGVNTQGSFTGIDGKISFDKTSPANAAFEINIDAAKVNTDNDTRDAHLRKEEYFNTDKYPKISFVSTKVTSKGNGFLLSGKLTMKGVAKDISFPFTVQPKDDGYLFEGSFKLNRRDYGVGGNSMVLGDEVVVTLSVFAKKM